jgi:hypothetical protein
MLLQRREFGARIFIDEYGFEKVAAIDPAYLSHRLLCDPAA